MKSKKFDSKYDFDSDTVEKKRKFPIANTILLVILVVVQLACVLGMILYNPKPQDVIEDYTIYVTPLENGSLNIEYRFKWTALDEDEELTWVEIGMANEYFTILDGFSDNIRTIDRYTDDEGYCYAQIYFKRAYVAGETLDFSFKVNQREMLASKKGDLFYELVPGWFNYAEVKHYSFNFRKYGDIDSFNGDSQTSEWLTWEGSLSYGDYVRMRVDYNSFDAPTVDHYKFNGDGAFDGLAEDKLAIVFLLGFVIIAALIGELVIVDSYVSYARGRGFLHGYGHPMHVYGYSNPRYVGAYRAHNASRGGGGGGRGCACACACACAGGGRAGCSQKDTYRVRRHLGEEK